MCLHTLVPRNPNWVFMSDILLINSDEVVPKAVPKAVLICALHQGDFVACTQN